MAKLKVGLIYGGRSGEHEVSLASAASVMRALNPEKYDVVPIAITQDGRWLAGVEPDRALAEGLGDGRPAALLADPSHPGLVPVGSPCVSGVATERLDVVFPVLHGPFGEDGTVQGLLELADIPFVGAGVLGSAAGMDKAVMKALFLQAGLPVGEYVVVRRSDWEAHPKAVLDGIRERLGYPCFVKPANLGSSVGISRVGGTTELAAALDVAARYDRKLIVEKGISGRELECAVLGNDEPVASTVGEVVPCRAFYDYEAKYLETGSRIVIPAPISEMQRDEVRCLSVQAFQAVNCAGLGRVDFFLEHDTDLVFVNEINTLPGFTNISMYPKLWEASGLEYSKLLDRLIELAFELHRDKRRSRVER